MESAVLAGMLLQPSVAIALHCTFRGDRSSTSIC